jgi:hypothetical protein
MATAVELDIWRSANFLIRRHGDEAKFFATKRAGALLEGGDQEGSIFWIGIARSIAEIERKKPDAGEPLN